ncbi:hypothetical protein HanIR_Chr06g0264971 [Helianthus annuus]|nr:hypothetical protein HanIR_Chr06g0264971 [Helianthus annuus]
MIKKKKNRREKIRGARRWAFSTLVLAFYNLVPALKHFGPCILHFGPCILHFGYDEVGLYDYGLKPHKAPG